MLNDEQILLKTVKLLEALSISEQKPEKLLRELDEIELEALDGILDDMKGEDLAFNKLFDGEMRKVIDFPTFDSSSELGQFREFFKSQEYDVDWEKAMVSAVRNTQSLDDTIASLMSGPNKKKTKNIQMKIGKYFAKVADLSSKKDALYQKVFDYMDKIDYTGAEGKIDRPSRVKIKMAKAALDEKDYESWNRIEAQINLYIPNPGVAGPAGYDLTDLATKYSKYWQTNAGYIKKEINKLDNEKYSIIITRHPIDVMRMSDFEKITSCHSPPSRGGGSIEYYKCAVAEAQGHGAIAYVVETEDLLYKTNTSNIESAEQEIQEGEIFADDNRGGGAGFDIEPVSRTRLRQMRYYDTDTPKRWDDGTELAVPEKRIYGVGIPGIADRVVKWAKANQEEAIKRMPMDADGNFDLDKFMIFGGSYEDTNGAQGREELMMQLTGWPESLFVGAVRQNRETEDALDANALSGMEGRYRQEIEEISNHWNNRYANTYVEAELTDDYNGGFYISVRPSMQWKWGLDEFTKLPNSYPTGMHAFDSINEIWGDLFDSSDGFINSDDSKNVRIGCTINLEHPEIHGEGYQVYDPDGLRHLCSELDTKMDDKRDAFQATIEEFLKREGWMEGGEYLKLAMEIEDGDITSYEWDLETDGDYSDSYESYASYSFEYNPEAVGISYEVLVKLLESREYKMLLRTNLLAAPRIEVGTEYYLDIAHYTVTQSGQEAVVQIQFKINADDPDERVGLFRDLAEGDMDDEDNLRAVFEKTLSEINGEAMSVDPAGDISEQLVGNWRRFLS